MMWFVLFLHYAWAGLPVEISPLYNHGIIYEKLDDVRLILGKWNLQAKYDMQSLVEEIKTAEKLVTTLQSNCNKLETSFGFDCIQITNDMKITIEEIRHFNEIINVTCQPVSRKKRQINVIGHIFKEIAGIMDHDDSSRIDKDLKNLYSNEENLKNQLQRQTVAIDTIFETNNRTISSMSQKINQFASAIDIYNKQSTQERSKNAVKNDFSAILGEFNFVINHLSKKGDLFLTLMETGEIPLTSKIYNPKSLSEDLVKVQQILPSGFLLS